MTSIGYYLALPFLYLISVLPFGFFYLLSDGICFLFYRIIGYRKKVVHGNLKNAFPEKTENELDIIERKFYGYLVDLSMETLKTLTISKKTALERCKMSENAKHIFTDLYNNNKPCIIVMGHYGNWEWAGNTFSLVNKQQLYVIYHPLSNKYFDKLMYDMRTRFGSKLYPMKDTMKGMIKNRHEINATAFIADQTPSPENAYWTTFLNQDTPVFWGTEKIAQKLNYTVVYASVNLLKRGYYEINAEILHDNPKDTSEGVISELHTRRLEKDIISNPECWLWSHRRWKHQRRN